MAYFTLYVAKNDVPVDFYKTLGHPAKLFIDGDYTCAVIMNKYGEDRVEEEWCRFGCSLSDEDYDEIEEDLDDMHMCFKELDIDSDGSAMIFFGREDEEE